ncbi:uncharacterized protein LOC126847464 [Adelges cooleyi]|uniref:uncharacterized protein LOC126847464 n=1 Tax=Adelges cooleyi TaxID=133065 RepID=UPI00217FBD06|nr:uncharacterized protein LOC126847464 [Adelges cooleyi]XP_050443662.1 uncharacterized protein LOC126847464 [Adelges cooleyi]XP_050443664.1 uncharacterized protein LOC126847464 [Adelges cooleyi]XP_050443665.1 uncharacterized protein LOC126847464 [Adelges cooleyi]
MEDLLKLVRSNFTRIDVADMDDRTIEELFFQNGPSRDKWIKTLVYEQLLDIDTESDATEHDLKRIFVEFGLLNKETADLFLKGDMSNEKQLACWKRIAPAFRPAKLDSAPRPDYETMFSHTYQKIEFLRSITKKIYLPAELMLKLKNPESQNLNGYTFEESMQKLESILKKSASDCLNDSSACDNSLLTDDRLNVLDVDTVKEEVANYIKICEQNQVTLPTDLQFNKISLDEFTEQIKNDGLTETDFIESKLNDVCELLRQEQELQVITESLANQ